MKNFCFDEDKPLWQEGKDVNQGKMLIKLKHHVQDFDPRQMINFRRYNNNSLQLLKS